MLDPSQTALARVAKAGVFPLRPARKLLKLALLVLPTLLHPATLPGAAATDSWELGVQAGLFLPDGDLTGDDERIDRIEPLGGARVGRLVADHWGWLLEIGFAEIDTDGGGEDTDIFAVTTGLELFLRPHWKETQWFVSFGGGRIRVRPAGSASFARTFASAGFGYRIELDERAHLRLELRGERTLDTEGPEGRSLARAGFLASLAWTLRGPARTD